MEEMCQFFQALKWKDETSNICCRSGKVVLVSLHEPFQESKQSFKDPFFLAKISSYNSILAFTSMGASLKENARMASNCEMIEKACTCPMLKKHYVVEWVHSHLLKQN